MKLRILLLPVLASLVASACTREPGAQEPERPEPVRMSRTTDVLRLVEDHAGAKGKKPKVHTWSLDGDARPLFFQHAPGRIVLGPIPPGESCALRFGMGLRPEAWDKSDGVEFKVIVQRGEERRQLFDELLDPRRQEHPRWVDREVPIPESADGAFSLILKTEVGQTRTFDQAGWGSPHVVCEVLSPPRPSSGRPHVLLISIDTLRPDHLGFYGYIRPTSPNLDALAGESLVFDHAFAPAPHTLPSHASMFTGLFPDQHGAGHRFPESPLPEEARTIAETLGAAGYRTLGFSSGGMMSARYGLSQGFEEWTERQPANLRSMMPAVLAALQRGDPRPVFLFLHTYDVHGPYEQPADFRFFQAADDAPRVSAEDWQALLETRAHTYQKLERFSGLPDVLAAYDSGIRFVDAQLATLFEYLRQAGVFEDMLLIVTSDHGESMFEHRRYISHAYTLSEEEVRIPLLVRLPRARVTGRREELVQLVDLVPLILAELDLEPESELAGRNPLLDPESGDAGSWVRGEASHTGARYIRTRDWKIVSATTEVWNAKKKIFGRQAGRFETGWQIFDLSGDPGEAKNLFGADVPGDVRRLIAKLRSFEIPGQGIGEAATPEGEHADALRALGYIQ